MTPDTHRPALSPKEHQRAAVKIMLGAIGDRHFALAGSAALREHGIVDRPTNDVDLFGFGISIEDFATAVDTAAAALGQQGYRVTPQRRAAQFARFGVVAADGYEFEVDFGVDWRANDPVCTELGPVLHLEDAVANKLSALYSRAYPRDFLDTDAIRRSGRFTDDRLLQAAHDHDPGFEPIMFGRQLMIINTLQPASVAEYGVSAGEFAGVKDRVLGWAAQLLYPVNR
jgi:hypothetical protein